MANLLKMAIVQSILSLHAQGWSARRIAKALEVHRDTVSRYIHAADPDGPKPANAPTGSDGAGAPKAGRSKRQNPTVESAAACQS